MGSRWIPRIGANLFGGSAPTPTPGAGATTFLWNATGMLSAFGIQTATLAGPTSDADVAGDGPFDGQREVASPATIDELIVYQRAPATAGSTTVTVEFYRIRTGTIVSLGTVTLTTAANMQRATGVPAVTELLAGDVLFVSFSAVPGIDAKDLSAYLTFDV